MYEQQYHPHPILRLLSTTWPLFRAFRVDVRVSWTIAIWPLFFFLSFSRFLAAGPAFGWSIAWTVGLFASVWTHEMGHIWAGRRCGIETKTITLRGLGGLAHLEAPAANPRHEIRIAAAGPVTHLGWLLVLVPATLTLRGANEHEIWFWMLEGFQRLQIFLMVFNLLPIYPLDGGRVLMGMLTLRNDATRGAYLTSTVGYVGNSIFIGLGLLALFTDFDPFGWGEFGFLLAIIGLEGFVACRRLRLLALHGGLYEAVDPYQKVLNESRAAMEEGDRREAKARERERAERERIRQLEQTVDQLLDRVSEAGGVDQLPRRERKALERASRELAKEREKRS